MFVSKISGILSEGISPFMQTLRFLTWHSSGLLRLTRYSSKANKDRHYQDRHSDLSLKKNLWNLIWLKRCVFYIIHLELSNLHCLVTWKYFHNCTMVIKRGFLLQHTLIIKTVMYFRKISSGHSDRKDIVTNSNSWLFIICNRKQKWDN